MEKLAVKQFKNIYRHKRVLVTGHTGFKGSWLSLWLSELGAEVYGLSQAEAERNIHWDNLNLDAVSFKKDIRCYNSVKKIFQDVRPEIVFHLAAQPIVNQSYRDPLETWSTNVMGTANVLEACKTVTCVRAIVVITTDKCYENNELDRGYRENDRLGGHDPYSASKAACELVCSSYRAAFFNGVDGPFLATARAGNVIGGGDWAEDRLIPDLIRATLSAESLEVRSPKATRPWQHVLESLSGYLLLGQNLLLENSEFCEAWNFGPRPNDNCSVQVLLEKAKKNWPSIKWHISKGQHFYEGRLLYLDSSKAKSRLRWQPIWDIETALEKTFKWYEFWSNGKGIISLQQLNEYREAAYKKDVAWIAK